MRLINSTPIDHPIETSSTATILKFVEDDSIKLDKAYPGWGIRYDKA
jgi:hypothetical protein